MPLNNRSPKIYKNIKCSLGSLLLPNSEDRIKSLIETRCLAVSKMAVKAYHLCRVMIENVLLEGETQIDWPDFTRLNVFVQLFTKGCNLRKANKPTKAIDWTWANYFENIGYPTQQIPQRHHSDYNLINYCAKTFQTAFINNLKLNLIPRQKRAITIYLANPEAKDEEREAATEEGGEFIGKNKKNNEKKKVDKSLVYALQKLINNNDKSIKGRCVGKKNIYAQDGFDDLRNEHADFIQTHQKLLQTGNLIDLIRYYGFLKREYGPYCTKLKNIPLVPQNEVKMHYIDFDAVGVKGLCHDMGKAKQLRDRSNAIDLMEKEGWNLIFNLRKLRKMGGRRWTFDRCIATDGVGCSIRYFQREEQIQNDKRRRSSSEDNNESSPETKRIKKEKNYDGGDDDVGAAASYSRKKKKTIRIRSQQLHDDDENGQSQSDIDNRKRIIGIDPGRKNIAYCVELDPETKKIIKKTRLTARQYYCDSGFMRYKQKVQTWLSEEKYKRINENLSKTVLAEDSFQAYLKLYVQNFNVIWQSKTCKKWRREKFRVYCLKKKTLAKFINKVIGDVSQPFHIAFGAAKFAPTGRGEAFSSPCSSLGKLIREKAGSRNFSLIDEWNTSKACHRCNQSLSSVKFIRNDQWEKDDENEEEGKMKKKERRKAIYPLRGLLRCSSQRKNNYDHNYHFNEDKETLTRTQANTPSSSFCPLGGMFVNRDSNAATNIALKFLLTLNHQISLPNLIRGVKIEKKGKDFWLDLNQKRYFYSQKKKTIIDKRKKHHLHHDHREGVSSVAMPVATYNPEF